MAEANRLYRFAVGIFLTIGVSLAFFCAAAPAASKGPLIVPGAFQLSASNGYTFDVIAAPSHAGYPASLYIYAFASGKGVKYVAPATVTETSMQANLGSLGEISVTFQRTNQPTRLRCGGSTIRLYSGQWEGTINFHGEEGYTSVQATGAPENLDFFKELCGSGFIEGDSSEGPRRGAELFVRNPGLGPHLVVIKKKPGAAAAVGAWMTENNNGILIERYANRWMPGGDFRYDRRLRTATVSPPAPFAGSARFDLGKKAGQRWSGDLTVDLPGKSGVPLTGPALRAYLYPAG